MEVVISGMIVLMMDAENLRRGDTYNQARLSQPNDTRGSLIRA